MVPCFFRRSVSWECKGKQTEALEKKYPDHDPAHWTDSLQEYETALPGVQRRPEGISGRPGDVEVRLMVLRKRRDSLCGAQEPDAVMEFWQQNHEQMGSLPHRPAGS